MNYFDNLNDRFLNKYKKILFNDDLNFYEISLSFNSSSKASKSYVIYKDFNLTFFYELSNVNEIR
jgi:hypothetical protein